MKHFGILLLGALVLILTPDNAYAYLDPGTGSMILQVLLAALAGIAIAVRLFWRRILAFFGIGKKRATQTAAAASAAPPANVDSGQADKSGE